MLNECSGLECGSGAEQVGGWLRGGLSEVLGSLGLSLFPSSLDFSQASKTLTTPPPLMKLPATILQKIWAGAELAITTG